MIAGLIVAAVVATTFGACTNQGSMVNGIDNSSTSEPEVTTTVTTGEKAEESVITSHEAILDKNVFTNTNYNYKITVPAGYTVTVEETRNSRLPDGGWDRAVITDAQGQEFATVRTPAPEVGFELWTWTKATRSERKITGSDAKIYRYEVPGDRAMGMEKDLIAASWGFDLHNDEIAATRDSDRCGLISAEVSANDSSAASKVRDLINSLRLI